MPADDLNANYVGAFDGHLPFGARPALLIVVCQVAVMYLVVHFGVGLQAKHPLATVALFIGARFARSSNGI